MPVRGSTIQRLQTLPVSSLHRSLGGSLHLSRRPPQQVYLQHQQEFQDTAQQVPNNNPHHKPHVAGPTLPTLYL